MPPCLSHIRTVVTAYLDRRPGERDALAGLLAALDAGAEPTNRTTLPAHITCSAVVIDRHRRVLHIRHKASGGLLLAPGGHVEADDDTLLAAALREVEEETGIPASSLVLTPEFSDEPIDIDVHAIDPNPARGEAAHWHYDARFVFYLAGGAPELALQAEEVTGSAWLPFDEVSSPTLRGKLAGSALDGLIVPGERLRDHPRRSRPVPAAPAGRQ
jgi:8-oxo-dGTP pyrophosphatase MutT (NUDIX family)